jgi:hypothetical protein
MVTKFGPLPVGPRCFRWRCVTPAIRGSGRELTERDGNRTAVVWSERVVMGEVVFVQEG